MKLAILVVARNQPEQVRGLVTRIKASVSIPHEIFVVEWGTESANLSRASSLWFADGELRGEGYALDLGLHAVRTAGDFDHVWVLRADSVIEAGTDVPARAIRMLEQEPTMAILAPARDGAAPAARHGDGRSWTPVATCAYPGFVLRMRAADEVGFVEPDFRFATGAIEELCYRLYAAGWIVAESAEIACRQDSVAPTVRPAEEAAARQLALAWLSTNHGPDWDRAFWRAAAGHGIADDRFAERRAEWEAGVGAAPVSEGTLEPWPLATDATYLLFGWPRYDDAVELDALLETFVRPILDRDDVCLCLRHDPAVDGPQVRAVAALEQSFQRVLGPSSELEVLLVDDELADADWPRLGRSVTCVLPLPSSRLEPRKQRLAALGVPAVATAGDLLATIPGLLPDLVREPRYTTEELDEVDWELVAQIKELHPWPHPVHVGNLAVQPGVGTGAKPEDVARRTTARAARLVFGVVERLDLRDRSVLELGAGCAFWSARYTERGARRVVAVERDGRALRQAELYWSRNAFLPPRAFRLLPGNLTCAATWDEISVLGPHDVTLCVDFPPEISSREEFLRRAYEVTREVLVLDLPGPLDGSVRSALEDLGLTLETIQDPAEPDRCTLIARRRAATPAPALPATPGTARAKSA